MSPVKESMIDIIGRQPDDSTYDEKNEDRVREADQDAKQRATG